MADKIPGWLTIVTDLQDFLGFPQHTAILDEGSTALHRKLDLNIVTEYEVLAFKFPNKMHTKLGQPERYAYEVKRFGKQVEYPTQERRDPRLTMPQSCPTDWVHLKQWLFKNAF